MPVTQLSDLAPQVSQNSPKRIWIINPFDQVPNETDVPLRYWALCKILAEQGHDVIWWSSDFSHLTKSKRPACPEPVEGPNRSHFAVRLIETPPYTKNISFARLKNHKAFADGFYTEAMAGLRSEELKAPDRIVVSLPPLGVAEQAFRIRDHVNNRSAQLQQANQLRENTEQQTKRSLKRRATAPPHQPSIISHPPSQQSCQVIVDIMDAWPETFYQLIPTPLRKALGPILLAPLHRSAKRAYHGADKISAVGQSYLNLAAHYLKQRTGNRGQKTDQSRSCVLQSQHLGAEATRETTAKARRYDHQAHQQSSTHHSSVSTSHSSTAKPMMLCYHGTDLSRFPPPPQSVITHSPSPNTPLRAVYLGAMGQGYDLQTIIDVAARWKAEGQFPWQIHFAGTGSQANQLMANGKSLIADKRIIFHGHIGREAITKLLLSAHLALVPNRPGSLVACPYKVGEYAGAGLPMLSCLGGELKQLLTQWDAGSEYKEGDAASLQAAFKSYSTNPEVLKQQSLKARKMAEALFDRETSYQELAGFILS